MKSVDVFGTKMQLSPNPMTAVYGKKPDGEECGDCVFFRRGRKSYHKCLKRGVTNGAGTDHRVHWPACGLYEASDESKARDNRK